MAKPTTIHYSNDGVGAASVKHVVSAANTNPKNVKPAPGEVIGWQFANTTAAWKYVKLHNTAGTPTAGASVFMTIGIPPNDVSNMTFEGGIAFSIGIALTITNLAADADTTVVAANDVVGDLFFA